MRAGWRRRAPKFLPNGARIRPWSAPSDKPVLGGRPSQKSSDYRSPNDLKWAHRFQDFEVSLTYPEKTHDYTDSVTKYAGFFKKSVPERRKQLEGDVSGLDLSQLDQGLPLEAANNMVENCIGTLGLPLGVAPNFVINSTNYVVPMAVEEPSVIAACSSVAKLVAQHGGFHADATGNIMTTQIQLLDLKDSMKAFQKVMANQKVLIDIANSFCDSMVTRGGGVTSIEPRIVRPRQDHREPYLVVHVHIDVCEAMGANICNTVAEGLSEHLAFLTKGRPALRILTNLSEYRRAISSFRLPIEKLSWKGCEGEEIAERIIEAYNFAVDDPYRAVTNNKGVMNGIDAAAIALGQDWRAIEAASHAHSCRNGFIAPMAEYKRENGYLVGTLELPIAVGSKGGSLATHPTYRLTHKLLGNPDAQTLAQILVSVGLAQNLAAMGALAVEGIQRGHMALHARNLCYSVGVPSELVESVTCHMIETKSITATAAKEYLALQ